MSTNGSDGPDDALEFAQALEQAFQRVYLQFHRREGKRSQLSAVSRSVLIHLSHTGPLTIGETAAHLDRAQSVVSDIVTQLERRNLLEREPDPADRRRTLVWLTPTGFAALETERQVLSLPLIARAASALPSERRAALLDSLETLLDTHPDNTKDER